jgi:hypothetical protein
LGSSAVHDSWIECVSSRNGGLVSDTSSGPHSDLPFCICILVPTLSLKKCLHFLGISFVRTKISALLLFTGNSGSCRLLQNMIAFLFELWVKSRKTSYIFMLCCHGVYKLGTPGILTKLFKKRKNSTKIHLLDTYLFK